MEKIVTTCFEFNPAPIDNGDGTVDFMHRTWNIIKDMGNTNKLIAMRESIGNLPFNDLSHGKYYFQTSEDRLDGYQDSLVKIMIDQWYATHIKDTLYEEFVQPVLLPNPTLDTMKALGWRDNACGFVSLPTWHREINAPERYPTKVGGTVKQAFLMSSSDVVKNDVGHLTDAANFHKNSLSMNDVKASWLRSPGYYYGNAGFLASCDAFISYYDVNFMYAVVPALIIRIVED